MIQVLFMKQDPYRNNIENQWESFYLSNDGTQLVLEVTIITCFFTY